MEQKWWRVLAVAASMVVTSGVVFVAPANAAISHTTVPTAPLSVHATVGNAKATVTWSRPSSNGGRAIRSFVVESTPAGHTCVTVATRCTISKLQNGTAYVFTVAARNSVGLSPKSKPSNQVKPAAPLFNVTFSANGGSGSMNDEINPEGTSATLTSAAFTKTGYTFSGWNTAANGSGLSYSDGATYLFDASVTLYAQWSVNSYSVTFDANGGSGTMAEETENYNVATALTLNTFTETGYTFNGWNSAADGTGSYYADGAIYPFTASTTLYAQWTVNSYSLTYVANGATSGATPVATSLSYNYDTSVTVLGNTGLLSRTGYTFSGWNTAANGSGASFSAGSMLTITGTTTLYAQWAIDSFVVTFSANGGVGSMASESEMYNVAAPLTLNTFTNAGNTFTGWNTVANGSGISYGDGASYLFDASVTLYAQWTPDATQFQTSTNWSGYVLDDGVGGYQGVSGQWTVPTLNCQATPNGNVSVWVGVNGVDSSHGLFQDGTTSTCSRGVETSYAWWTDESEGYEGQTLFDVNTGDVITASVSQTSTGGMWTYRVADARTGAVASQAEAYSGAGTSAEWIVEDPGMTNGGLYPLGDFNPMTVTDLGLTVPSGSWTLPTPSDGLELLAADGSIAALPGPFSGSGAAASFTVTYQTPS